MPLADLEKVIEKLPETVAAFQREVGCLPVALRVHPAAAFYRGKRIRKIHGLRIIRDTRCPTHIAYLTCPARMSPKREEIPYGPR